MRKTITISVSEEMFDLIQEGTRTRYYSSVSEYIRYLVRCDRRPETATPEKPVSRPVRTANECMEIGRREREAEESAVSVSRK